MKNYYDESLEKLCENSGAYLKEFKPKFEKFYERVLKRYYNKTFPEQYELFKFAIAIKTLDIAERYLKIYFKN